MDDTKANELTQSSTDNGDGVANKQLVIEDDSQNKTHVHEIVESLQILSTLLRISYCTVINNLQLEIKIQNILKNLLVNCSDATILFTAFERASQNCLDAMQCSYRYLEDCLEDNAKECMESIKMQSQRMIVVTEEFLKKIIETGKITENLVTEACLEKERTGIAHQNMQSTLQTDVEAVTRMIVEKNENEAQYEQDIHNLDIQIEKAIKDKEQLEKDKTMELERLFKLLEDVKDRYFSCKVSLDAVQRKAITVKNKAFENVWDTLEQNDEITAYYAKYDEEYKATQTENKRKHKETQQNCEEEYSAEIQRRKEDLSTKLEKIHEKYEGDIDRISKDYEKRIAEIDREEQKAENELENILTCKRNSITDGKSELTEEYYNKPVTDKTLSKLRAWGTRVRNFLPSWPWSNVDHSSQKPDENPHTDNGTDSINQNMEPVTHNRETTIKEDLSPYEKYEQDCKVCSENKHDAKIDRDAKIRKAEAERDKSITEAREAHRNNVQTANDKKHSLTQKALEHKMELDDNAMSELQRKKDNLKLNISKIIAQVEEIENEQDSTMQKHYQWLEDETKHYEKACKDYENNKQTLLEQTQFEIDNIDARIKSHQKEIDEKKKLLKKEISDKRIFEIKLHFYKNKKHHDVNVDYEISISCLREANKELSNLQSLVENVKFFWSEVNTYCTETIDQTFSSQIRNIQHLTEKTRQHVWKSKEFKSNSLKFFNQWNALKATCCEVSEQLRNVEMKVSMYVCKKLTKEETDKLIQELWIDIAT